VAWEPIFHPRLDQTHLEPIFPGRCTILSSPMDNIRKSQVLRTYFYCWRERWVFQSLPRGFIKRHSGGWKLHTSTTHLRLPKALIGLNESPSLPTNLFKLRRCGYSSLIPSVGFQRQYIGAKKTPVAQLRRGNLTWNFPVPNGEYLNAAFCIGAKRRWVVDPYKSAVCNFEFAMSDPRRRYLYTHLREELGWAIPLRPYSAINCPGRKDIRVN
jgi:hypothetical protein